MSDDALRRALFLREMGIAEWQPRSRAEPETGVGRATAWGSADHPVDEAPVDTRSDEVRAATMPTDERRCASDPSPRRQRISALDWDALAADVAGCTACGLCASRRQTVFGVGNRNARWMLVGEAPGAEEDARGEPFVGQAGRLLDSMLAANGLKRADDVFIANVLKCRPPGNRDPQPAEVASCEPYLERQLALVDPDIVVVLGRFAAQSLLATEASIARLRGREHDIEVQGRRVPMVVTYHPAYLLRTPGDKAKAWADWCMAAAIAARVARS